MSIRSLLCGVVHAFLEASIASVSRHVKECLGAPLAWLLCADSLRSVRSAGPLLSSRNYDASGAFDCSISLIERAGSWRQRCLR